MKVAGEKLSQGTTCPIYDLFPGGILKEVASFLTAPSKALFAVAIAPPISPYDEILARSRSKLSRSPITGNDHAWHTLDFGDIEKVLAAKLTDDDIRKVLLHIDAAHKLKRLLLTNCINISGAGLSPLRHSTTIEQIDLSLVKAHQKPDLYPVPPLSCDQVLPILQSIINHERNSLRHVHFPHSWRYPIPANPQFIGFLDEFNQMTDATFCKKCDTNVNECVETSDGDPYFGIQEATCGVCTNTYCNNCKADDNHFEGVRLCQTCQRCYCSKCSPMVECGNCEDMYCVCCMSYTECANSMCSGTFCNPCHSTNRCEQCDRSWCYICDLCLDCSYCDQRYCVECSMKEGVNGVHTCNDCESSGSATLCDRCRMHRCQSGSDECKSCTKMVSSLILKQNKKLNVENKSLKKEVKDLKKENNDIKDTISEVRGILNGRSL